MRAFAPDPPIYPLVHNYDIHPHVYSLSRVAISQVPLRLELFGYPKLVEANYYDSKYDHKFTEWVHTVINKIERNTSGEGQDEMPFRGEWLNIRGEKPEDSRVRHLSYKNPQEELKTTLSIIQSILSFTFIMLFLFRYMFF